MNKVYVMITLCCVPLLYACEKKDALNKPNTEARTMIIGGVPVHEKDYKLAGNHLSLNNQSLNEVQVNSTP